MALARYSEEQWDQARGLWEEGIPAADIALTTGIPVDSVYQRAMRYAWTKRARVGRRGSADQWVQAEQLWTAKTPVLAIAKATGLTPSQIYKASTAWGLRQAEAFAHDHRADPHLPDPATLPRRCWGCAQKTTGPTCEWCRRPMQPPHRVA